MAFYSNSKEVRKEIVKKINGDILADLNKNSTGKIIEYFGNEDTYIRKTAYIAVGNIVLADANKLKRVLNMLDELSSHDDYRIRQSVINAAGEIGKKNFSSVEHFFDKGLNDIHHSPRNAVIGSIKKMGEVNPEPVLKWARRFLHHPDKEIRREICHGIELRGRTHPQDILPLLKELQHDQTARVRNTLVHVIGQIAYKKGCLAIVVNELKHWDNKQLVQDALAEIVDVHDRYQDFAALTKKQAKDFIRKAFQIK
jgi:HEAT repeat protein